MDKPLFSILTASYNNARYLTDWANSILEQRYRPLEVVFVNDCSKDNTSVLIKSLADNLRKHGIQVIILSNENRMYYSSALKSAWTNAKGEFFGVLDSDDCLEAGSVEYIMDIYTKNPEVGWIYTQFEQYDIKMDVRRNPGFSRPPKLGKSLLDMAEKGHHGYSHWRTFSNRVPNLHKIFKDGLKCAVDKYMAYRLEEVSMGMFAPRICYRYRHGVPSAISRVERSINTWRKIIKEARDRRTKYGITPIPISSLDYASGKRI